MPASEEQWEIAAYCPVCGAEKYQMDGVWRHTCEHVPDYEDRESELAEEDE